MKAIDEGNQGVSSCRRGMWRVRATRRVAPGGSPPAGRPLRFSIVTMIRLTQIYKRHGQAGSSVSSTLPALSGVTLKVEKGECVVLAGPGGAGKSTLLKIVWGEVAPDGGEVWVDGKDVAHLSASGLSALRLRMGLIAQGLALSPDRTVFDQVALPLRMAATRHHALPDRVRKMLQRVRLNGYDRRLISSLAEGERQRVAIARALVHHPVLLLADEPTHHLDDAAADEMAALLNEVHVTGTTVVVATRHCGLLARLRGRIVMIQRGQLVDEGVV